VPVPVSIEQQKKITCRAVAISQLRIEAGALLSPPIVVRLGHDLAIRLDPMLAIVTLATEQSNLH
jgi:hypothetical protein